MQKKPTAFAEPIEAPAALASSSDPQASMCNSYIQMANSITSFASYFEVPEGATPISTKSTGVESYTWSYGGVTIFWTLTETTDKYIWTISISDAEHGIVKGKYMEAEETKDGKSGQLIVYNYTADGEAMGTFSWETLVDDTFNFKYEYSGILIELNVYSDNSGTLDYTIDSALLYHFEWAADGSGSWVMYSGETETSGTWSK
jgi:hypothetical protein